MPHRITIPGLDYDRCGDCGQYLIRDGEIQRMEQLISHKLARNRDKEATELQLILLTEKQRRSSPCPSNQSNSPAKYQ